MIIVGVFLIVIAICIGLVVIRGKRGQPAPVQPVVEKEMTTADYVEATTAKGGVGLTDAEIQQYIKSTTPKSGSTN